MHELVDARLEIEALPLHVLVIAAAGDLEGLADHKQHPAEGLRNQVAIPGREPPRPAGGEADRHDRGPGQARHHDGAWLAVVSRSLRAVNGDARRLAVAADGRDQAAQRGRTAPPRRSADRLAAEAGQELHPDLPVNRRADEIRDLDSLTEQPCYVPSDRQQAFVPEREDHGLALPDCLPEARVAPDLGTEKHPHQLQEQHQDGRHHGEHHPAPPRDEALRARGAARGRVGCVDLGHGRQGPHPAAARRPGDGTTGARWAAARRPGSREQGAGSREIRYAR